MPGIPAAPNTTAVWPNPAAPTRIGVPAPTRKLHPLHSAEWLCAVITTTGCYPDTERATGRTTALALSYIAQALSKPHEVIEVRDHHDLRHCHAELVRIIHEMTRKLGLQGFLCNPPRLTIQFTNPIAPPGAPHYTI